MVMVMIFTLMVMIMSSYIMFMIMSFMRMSTTSKAIVSMITFVTFWEIGVSFHTGVTFVSDNVFFA
jgi:hypothetical protein